MLRRGYFGAHQQTEQGAGKFKEEHNNEALTRFAVQEEAEEPSERLQQNHNQGYIAHENQVDSFCGGEKQDGQSDPETDVNGPEFIVAARTVEGIAVKVRGLVNVEEDITRNQEESQPISNKAKSAQECCG